MATTCITDRCRDYWFRAAIDFTAETFNMSLYDGSGHDQNTTSYTATSEAAGVGYVAKGVVLSGFTGPTIDAANHVVYVDWNDAQWTSSTITATDCLIFADSVVNPQPDPAVYVGDFNGSRSSSNGTFSVQLPLPAYNSAIVRIA